MGDGIVLMVCALASTLGPARSNQERLAESTAPPSRPDARIGGGGVKSRALRRYWA